MAKQVVVIASGETERRSIPILMRHLKDQDVDIDNVHIPPHNRALNVDMAERLIKAAWYSNQEPINKFVVLIDIDGSSPDIKLAPFEHTLPKRLENEVSATILLAFAQWHLEAWYFADATNLRNYLGKALGSVDSSKPDEIQNPKLHLKNLLGERIYTSGISHEIAGSLDAQTIAERSPSFRGFRDAVLNGETMVSTTHD